jgi:hypothetical protein
MFSLKFTVIQDPGLTAQVTSGVVQGSDVATGSLVRVGGENVGAYAINRNHTYEQTMTRRM